MIGLICIGLLGLGTVIFITRSTEAQQAAAVPDTPTPIPPTFTPTSTPSATPTETPPPTPTATPVISQGSEAQDTEGVSTQPPVEAATTEPGATPTNTLVLQTPATTDTPTSTPAPAAQIPASGGVLPGGNGFLMWAGIVLLVLLTFGVANHLKSSPPKV